MTIVKKSGRKEAFSAEKLAKSIAGACSDANAPLSDEELKEITVEFQQIVNGKSLMTSRQIDVIINGLLYTKGYFGILEQYVTYQNKK